MIFLMSAQQGKAFAGGIWTGSEGRVHCCFPCNFLLSTAQNHCVTQYFVGQRLEAPWVCLRQGYTFRSLGTWNTGVIHFI